MLSIQTDPQKSLGWSWKRIPGIEFCLKNLPEKLLTKHPLENNPDSRDKQPRRAWTVGVPHSHEVCRPCTRCLQQHFLLYPLPSLKATAAFSVTWKLICCFKRSICPISLSFSLRCKYMQDVYDSKQQERWGVSPALIKAGSSYNFTHVELRLLVCLSAQA